MFIAFPLHDELRATEIGLETTGRMSIHVL